MEREQRPLALRTTAGPVDLRPPRQERRITPIDGGASRIIKKGWLKDAHGDTFYQKTVKQAMMIAAEELRLMDAKELSAYSMATPEIEDIQERIQTLQSGNARFTVSGTKKKKLQNVSQHRQDRKRDTLVKISRKRPCCSRVERSFIIDNGELLVYRDHHPNAKVKAMYQLKNATCFYEDRNSASLPKWMEGYNKRLRVICNERELQSKSPLFLYSKDDAKIHRWKRAFTLAKVLVSENDRRALKVSIGRATSGALQKAWDALSMYYSEYAKTKALVKNMAMRLMKVDISRGWMKFKLVYRKKEDERRRRKDQQIWAARFMSEKLTKLGKQKAKEILDVREGVITRIQQRFRSYREDMIFDRTYPLNSSMMSRVQQAKVGRHLDFTMQTVAADDVCHLCLRGEAWEKWDADKEVFRSMTPAYSALHDGSLAVQPALVYASDNLGALFFAERSASEPSAFDKTDWSKFINMDRISSVILHSEPRCGASIFSESFDAGVWCTVNGPRVAWDRRVTYTMDKDQNLVRKVRGDADHLKVASEIATGKAKKWVQLTGKLDQVMMPKPKDLQDEDFKTKAIFHLLGYSFESKVVAGGNPNYNLTVQAAVPVASDDFVCLDESEVGVQIYQVSEEGQTSLLYIGADFLTEIFDIRVKEDGTRDPELAQRLKDVGSVRNYKGQYKLQLVRPGALPKAKFDEIKDKKDKDLEEEVKAEVDVIWNRDASPADNLCVSPELVGGGVNTILFTSNRAAWFDPKLGAGKFRPDHVANYVELSLSSLNFQPPEKAEKAPAGDKDLDHTYYVRASLNGISVSSSALHRAKPSWAQVLPHHLVDPNTIRFEGQRLLIPLLAGCWGDEKRELRIEVVEVTRKSQVQTLTLEDFKQTDKKDAINSCSETVKYKAMLVFDSHMLVDQQKTLGVFLVKPDQEDIQMDVYRPLKNEGMLSEGMLSLDFCLRDRDHARATMGQPGQRSALCVGDKAMLIVEEPFLYPKDASEFRKQFCVGEYSAKKKDWPHPGAPLREPCLSSEYADSGLGELVPKRPFKQSFIPTFCDDIMPHKYVLPLSEKEFTDKHKPGFWTRIMDDFAKGVARGEQRDLPYRSGPNKPIVSHLTHMNRHVPVTLLAMYSDGTCDLEVTELFIKKWEKQKYRKFGFYGQLRLAEDRFILRKVPQILVSAVHYSGINVYDSAFKTTEDVIKAPKPSNAFDPRSAEAAQNAPKDEIYQYSLAAGPLPPDASPACCSYEFSVRLRFPNEFEMYHFVAMLRRCVRVDHYQQALKMAEYQKRTQTTPVQQRQVYKSGGQLDVVLVEARRLKPLQSALNTVLQSDPIALYESWSKGRSEADPSQSNQMLDPNYLPELMGTTDGQMVKQTPNGSAISTFVNFRMLHRREVPPGAPPLPPEVVSFRGQKVQISPVIDGTDSPCWAKLSELEQVGGWTFRTGIIDPEKYPKLLIEFEVMQAGIPSATRIGAIHIPVTEEQFLTNPDQLFKNLWLPLVKDGAETPNVTGEIHVMTRWLPAEMKQVFSDGQEKMQLSVRSMFVKDIWHKVCQSRIREPVYNTEAVYHRSVYNPNMVRVKKEGPKRQPEAFKDNFRRHVEELSHAVHYLECLERRQMNAWNLFQNELQEKGYENRSLGELRLHWQEVDDSTMLNKLQSLILRGVPSSLRQQVWAEITLASRVSATDGAGATRDYADEEELAQAAEKEYQTLLARGSLLNTDAMHQLQEDSVLLAAWESSSPPLPEALELHLKRIKKAKNVVTALLACEDGGVTSCESLLVLAFFLLLPQGCKEASSVSGTGEGLVQPAESSVFWLLYTLICTRVNGMYREYYGQPLTSQSEPPSLLAGSGAMQDVNLLECCMAYHERDLYFRMTALGFELSTIFYGAFMRWYATFIPTATVFRFWDALLFQSTNPKTQSLGGRDYLIDLAFATLRAKRNELMECESAAEMKSVVLGFLGSLYDTTTVIDLVHAADLYLWGGAGFSSGKVSYLWTQRDEIFKSVNQITKYQNQILQKIAFEGQARPANHPTEQQLPGITTKQLTKEVIPTLQINIEGLRSRDRARHWAMHRPMPLTSRNMLQTSSDKAWSLFSASSITTPHVPMIPFMVGPPNTGRKWPGMEPMDVTTTDLISVIQRHAPGWSSYASQLWQYFSNRPQALYPHSAVRQSAVQKVMGGILGMKPSDDPNVIKTQPQKTAEGTFPESLSLNELFGALICCSRGTVAAKAAALFDLYAYSDPRGRESDLVHQTKSNNIAKSTTAHAMEAAAEMSRILAPSDPDSDESKRDNVLRFTVMTSYPKEGVLGDVLIPSLSPYISASAPVLKSYNIWGKQAGRGGAGNNSNTMSNNNIGGGTGEKMVCLGEIFMAIQWQPRSYQNLSKGQLSIQVKHVKFHEFYILEPFNINPWITVTMSVPDKAAGGDSRKWAEVKRWDPRGLAVNAQRDNVAVTQRGPYGGHIKFDPTMRTRAVGGGGVLGQWVQYGNQGWVPASSEKKTTGHWEWNDVWGRQSSIKDLEVGEDYVQHSSRRNIIDLMGVRLLVTQVLQRCMLNMSNRQAVMVADSIFNRAGVVPGICQAVLAAGTEHSGSCKYSLTDILEDFESKKKPYVDVTREIVFEHERQCTVNGGLVNLFSPSYMMEKLNLLTLGISDPYPKQRKTLYVRFVRGGDGERCTEAIHIEENGDIEASHTEVHMDALSKDNPGSWAMSRVTKEEFVACFTSSPLLSESLRRLASCDATLHRALPIPLEVTIMDPQQDDIFQDLDESINLQQSILVEVWDSDFLGMDFLGEAWLPPLSEFGPRPKDIVLPLQPADFRPEAEFGSSRQDSKKNLKDEKLDPNQKVTGEIFLSVTWVYPTIEGRGLDIDVDTWLKHLETKNKIDDGKLRKYQDEILNKYRTVRAIREQQVTREGVLKEDFFTELKITDKRLKDILKKFFKDASAEDLKARAHQQEQKHSGMLTIKIERAERLRRADARKMRDCDPKVYIWVRNDAKQAWHKKPLMQSGRISNDRNPVWNHQETKRVFSGAFEAEMKDPPHGWGAKAGQMLSTRSRTRKRQEDAQLAAVRRFGADGLKISFGSKPDAEKLGTNHEVDVLLTDSIRDFKEKLTQACAKECRFWKEKDTPETAQSARKYADVEVGSRHLVMAYIPSKKVAEMTQKNLTNSDEFKRQSRLSLNDPSNWQPLDAESSFAQYVNMFGFGQQRAVLKVVEATEAYKAVNLRYKKWIEDKRQPALQDLNDNDKCFGWAKYFHEDDSSTSEWRPAVLGRGKEDPNKFSVVKWVYPPPSKSEDDPDAKPQVKELDKADVLLAPRAPKIDDQTHERHKGILPQAKLLRSSGKSDWEIETYLNKILERQWDEAVANNDIKDGEVKPPRITIDQIRAFLQRAENQAGKLL